MNASSGLPTAVGAIASASAVPPKSLPLHAWHVSHGARMAPFSGWNMPINYALGILGEHRHTRAAAGLFDVSHMGQILLRPRSGDIHDAARALEMLVPVDVLSLRPGRQRYAFLTNESGGIRDDLMIANLGTCLYLVVNAANTDADVSHLQQHLAATCTIEVLTERALLAIQGPKACAALAALVPSVMEMRFMDAGLFSADGTECFISRAGYTGEDGFEISLPAAAAVAMADRLTDHSFVQLAGLGARDSLRLEAGLCLYGHDLDARTTPVEAAIEWAIQPVRREGGVRAGGFLGAEVILSQLSRGAPRKRVGLRPEGRPAREGTALFPDATSSIALGRITSGTYGPSAQCPIAMGYVAEPAARIGDRLFAEIRGERTPVTLSAMPFVPHRYHR